MNDRYLYLVINLSSIIVPFIASFYPKASFARHYRAVWPAIILPAILFIVWDEVFTQWGVWGFNSRYLTGIFAGSLPLEEILFFICIPYACLFTYFAFGHLVKKDFLLPYRRIITSTLMIALFVMAIVHYTKWYTAVTFASLALFLFYHWLKNHDYLGRFYFSYLIILIPFFIVNGLLTGSWIEDEVVWYNNAENLGLRMGTIPVEDTFYGMLLIMMNVTIYEWLKRKKVPA